MIADRRPEMMTNPQDWVVVKPEYPPDLAYERKKEQGFTCQGIDDKHGLDICIFQIVGIDGRYVPASKALGFETHNSH